MRTDLLFSPQQDVELMLYEGGVKGVVVNFFSLDFQFLEELGLLRFLSLQRREFSSKLVDGFGSSRSSCSQLSAAH